MTHPDCLGHDPGSDQAETPQRLKAILQVLRAQAFSTLVYKEAPLATIADLATAHTAAHIDRVFAAIPTRGLWNVDPDTVVSPGSGLAALRAAGAVCEAVDAVLRGEANNAFCAVRPGGHHARADRTAGYCLFNNVAIGALRARNRNGLSRIAIVDIDLHHGDGTQDLFWSDPAIFFASVHQWPFDPGTGAATEQGAHGNVLNLPLSAGAGGRDFRAVIHDKLLPRLRAFAPQFVLISAGFDAHKADPLGNLCLEDEDYYWVARELLSIAKQYCEGRLVAVLEGGYDLHALGTSTVLFVRALVEASSEQEIPLMSKAPNTSIVRVLDVTRSSERGDCRLLIASRDQQRRFLVPSRSPPAIF